jgi:hypothetical protein
MAYKRQLTTVYGLKKRPAPDEFLHAIDYRTDGPARGKPRIVGLIAVLERAISGC